MVTDENIQLFSPKSEHNFKAGTSIQTFRLIFSNIDLFLVVEFPLICKYYQVRKL
jgi:hypothetical protein